MTSHISKIGESKYLCSYHNGRRTVHAVGTNRVEALKFAVAKATTNEFKDLEHAASFDKDWPF